MFSTIIKTRTEYGRISYSLFLAYNHYNRNKANPNGKDKLFAIPREQVNNSKRDSLNLKFNLERLNSELFALFCLENNGETTNIRLLDVMKTMEIY